MDKIELTSFEQVRYDIIRSCVDGDITNREAGIRLGLKVRQVQNLKRAIGKEGKDGAVHKTKGKISHNATDVSTLKKVITFLKEKQHRDFGPTFAQEKLKKIGIVLDVETVRSIMIKEGLWKEKKRRGPDIIHQWRERRECYGDLIQFDGCYHDWFETGSKACLLASIDDATSSIVHAVFEENEGVFACFRFWKRYVESYGRPVAIYLDKFSTYKINHKNAIDNPEWMTQFERAMKDLDIRVICANSPEAKGRVERLFFTLQDRLVKEMRLARVKKEQEGNVFIHGIYKQDHNQRFGVQPKSDSDVHRPLTDMQRKSIDAIFSKQEKRKVNNDYTLQFKTRWFQLEATQPTPLYKRDTVTVEEQLDGTLRIRMKDVYLKYHELPKRPKKINVPVIALTEKKPHWTPPPDHPWKKSYKNL